MRNVLAQVAARGCADHEHSDWGGGPAGMRCPPNAVAYLWRLCNNRSVTEKGGTAERWSPLSNAIEIGDGAEVERILRSDPGSVHRTDSSGLTPLGGAVDVVADSEQQTGEAYSTHIVERLLEAGADPDQEGRSGTSARELAKRYRHEKLLNIFSCPPNVGNAEAK